MRKKSSLFYKPKPAATAKSKRKWVILPYLWRAVKYTCMSIGAMIILSLIIGFFFTATLMKNADINAALPTEMILFYKLEGAITEGPPTSGFEAFGPRQSSLRDIIEGLEVAATDDRVKALVFSVRSSQLALSQIQELRTAILNFKKASGKPAYIYSMSYAEAGQGLALYSLASAFDEIWISPLGSLSINGLQIEQPYMRDLLNFVGIEPQFLQREEYKGVFENFSESGMTDASREAYEALTKSFVKGFIKDIITARPRLAEGQELSKLINQGLFLDRQALEKGLVDRVEYGDILLNELREKLGGDKKEKTPEMVRIGRYNSYLTKENKNIKAKKNDLAVIYIQGPIMITREGEQGNSLIGETSESADQIAALIVRAAENKHVKSIVLRVDSPGGSPTASELIRRAVLRAQEMEKDVIVSMGSMAASGGYWVSAPADHIFALPATITGSIGVAGGKISMREFWQNTKVNWDKISIGRNAGMYSIHSPFTESERELVEASMDHIYDTFLGVVAEGRNMLRKEVRNVAKGRVWTGEQALEVGLVDELGGLNEALDYAAKQAGFNSRKDMNIIILPEPKTPIEEIMELFSKTASLPALMDQQSALMDLMISAPDRQKLLRDAAVMQNSNGVFVYESMESLQ